MRRSQQGAKPPRESLSFMKRLRRPQREPMSYGGEFVAAANAESSPKRVAKIRRTAGTSELPPVRKTRSTGRGSTPELSQQRVDRVSIVSSSSAIHDSKSVSSRECARPCLPREIEIRHYARATTRISAPGPTDGVGSRGPHRQSRSVLQSSPARGPESARSSKSHGRCWCARTRDSASAQDSRRSTPARPAGVC